MSEQRTRFVSVNGASLFLREYGADGDLAPVVMLHGWPQHGGIWKRIAPELAADRRVLVPDLRGFGRSDAPPGSYEKHELAADVIALLDAEGIEKAVVIGHDWGAWISWLLALEHPERVERFVAADITPPWRSGFTWWRAPLTVLFGLYQPLVAAPFLGERVMRRPGFARLVMRSAAGLGMRWTREELDSYALPLTEPDRARASVHVYRTMVFNEIFRVLAGTYTSQELTIPGLTVFGSQSPVKRMIGLPKPLPNLRVEVVAGAGHFVPDEKPAEFLALVKPFLSEAAIVARR